MLPFKYEKQLWGHQKCPKPQTDKHEKLEKIMLSKDLCNDDASIKIKTHFPVLRS